MTSAKKRDPTASVFTLFRDFDGCPFEDGSYSNEAPEANEDGRAIL